MRTIKLFHWAALLLMAISLYSCQKIVPEEQGEVETPTEEQTWTVRIEASIGNDQTKALELVTGGIKATWTENDPVYVYSHSGMDVTYKGRLSAESSGTSTTFAGELTGTFNVDDEFYLYYPKIEKDFRNQKGTLQYISNNCDFAEALVKVLSVDGENKIVTTERADFSNQVIIWKLKFMDGENAVKVKKMDFYSKNAQLSAIHGSNVLLLTDRLNVELDEAAEEVFISLEKSDNAADTYSFVLFDEDGNYYDGTKTVSKALERGKYYKSTVNVNKHPQILIGTPEELNTFANTVNSQTKQNGDPGYDSNNPPYYCVKLTADIDCSSLSDFPGLGYGISNSDPIFNGVFDGDGHTISNLTINRAIDGVGFFGQFRGTVRNLTLENCVISGASYVGGHIGYVTNFGQGVSNVENCHFIGVSASVSGTGNSVGGLIGRIGGKFKTENSTFSGSVSAQKYVGGIIGEAHYPAGTSVVSNCTAGGSVYANGGSTPVVAGGIIGYFVSAQGMTTIMNCTNNANVTVANESNNAQAGGIIGNAYTNNGRIYHCTNNGTITGNRGNKDGQMLGTLSSFDFWSNQNFTIEN